MRLSPTSLPLTWTAQAWSSAVLTGVAIPVLVMLVISSACASLVLASSPLFTLGLMGAGIIGAATVGNFWIGVLLALLNATCLVLLALALGLPALPYPVSTGLAMVIASISFAARGALFAKTLAHRGWLMALFVVTGEASVLLIATVSPGTLPDWFLALLPAQWSSIAMQTAFIGTGTVAESPVLFALAGTAVTTLLAAELFPKRWPYALMFSAWLGLSALVYFSPTPTTSNTDVTCAASASTRAAPIAIAPD